MLGFAADRMNQAKAEGCHEGSAGICEDSCNCISICEALVWQGSHHYRCCGQCCADTAEGLNGLLELKNHVNGPAIWHPSVYSIRHQWIASQSTILPWLNYTPLSNNKKCGSSLICFLLFLQLFDVFLPKPSVGTSIDGFLDPWASILCEKCPQDLATPRRCFPKICKN